jgi:hypothetical protein
LGFDPEAEQPLSEIRLVEEDLPAGAIMGDLVDVLPNPSRRAAEELRRGGDVEEADGEGIHLPPPGRGVSSLRSSLSGIKIRRGPHFMAQMIFSAM